MRLRSNRVTNWGKPKIVSKMKKDGFSNERRLSLRSSKLSYGKRGESENLELGVKKGLNADEKGVVLGLRVLDPVKDSVFSCPTDEMEEEGHEMTSLHLNETGLDSENGSRSLEPETFADDTTIVNGHDDKETSLNDHDKDLFFSCRTETEEEEGDETASLHLNETGLNCKNGYNKCLECETFADDTIIVNGDLDKETSLNDPVKDMVVSCTKDEVEEEEVNESMSKSLEPEAFDDTAIINCDDDKETSLDDSGNAICEEVKEKGRQARKKKNVKKGKLIVNQERIKFVLGLKAANDECELMPLKHKRGRKRKNVVASGSDCNRRAKKEKVEKDGVGVKECDRRVKNEEVERESGKALRSSAVVLGLQQSDEIPNNMMKRRGRPRKVLREDEMVLGSKGLHEKPKKMLKGRGRPRKVLTEGAMVLESQELDEIKEIDEKPKKMLKGRGRPRKVLTEDEMVLDLKELDEKPIKMLKGRGRPRKVLTEDEMVLELKELDEKPKKMLKRRGRPRKVLTEGENMRPKKKLKRRGRPCKIQDESTPLALNENEIPKKKLERRGRPRKVSHENPEGAVKSCGIKQKLYEKGITFKKFKRRGRPPKMEAKALAAHVIKMRTVKPLSVEKSTKICQNENPEEKSENLMVEGEFSNAGTGIIGGNLARKQLKQLIREKISNILLKCGWTIKLKPRPEKSYNDAVYTEPDGKRSHWSITRAYAKLKWKIENGHADDIEMSEFTPIPEEEFSILFKPGYKTRKEKKKKTMKKVKKGKLVTDKKKKHGKKAKDESKRKMIFKPRLLVRGSENGPNQDNEGALVVKKRNLLSWMIDSGVILAGTKVQYWKTRRQKMSYEGIVTNDGISCDCCNEVMGITKFVSHCGGKFDQFLDNLYLESGTCLRKCLMDSWRKEEESNVNRFNAVVFQGDDPNDDTCNICGDGGDLICCDGCPSTFHQSCLDVQSFPSGDWNCIYCTCKFCGVVSGSTPHVEDFHDPITSQMLSCCLCEEKFHQLCLQEGKDVNKDSNALPFCGSKCQELFERLQTHLGVKHELEDGFSWTLLQRSDVDQESNFLDSRSKVEQNSKLAIAFHVMDECFLPIVDGRSGTNIIRSVVYNCGSNVRRLNYAGFLTAVLEKDDEFITAASIRIHGYQLAEMPFIGTRQMYRRQGMCRRLLDAIESTLSSLGVEELIIPAIPELLQTWINVFGFMPLDESKKQVMKCMSMMVFPGIDMLKKPLLQNQSADVVHTPNTAGVEKDVIDHEQKEDTVLCSSPKTNDENNPQIENTSSSNATDYKQTISHGVNNLYDLNLPAKNVFPCDKDGQTSVDSELFPDCTTEPSSLDSVKLDVDNDGVPGVKVNPSPTSSKLVLKNTFDLNLHPTAIETDVLQIASDDSVQCEPQACIVSFEISDSRSQVDQSANGQTDSKTCESQPLVMH